MPFKKGQSGNPGGRIKGEGEIRDALRKVLHEVDADTRLKNIDAICAKLVNEAKQGNVAAFSVIADRVDGKAQQPVSGDLGATIYHVITGVPRGDDPPD